MTAKELVRGAKDFWRPNRYKLKKFLLCDGKTHPFAVICPGGGYGMVCSFLEGDDFARKLNDMGFHAFVVCYRVRRRAAYPAPQDDLARAVQEILEHAEAWDLDTGNYSVWGSSAGGHLAASFGTRTMGYRHYALPKPGALILSYPVITMEQELTHSGSRKNLLGRSPSQEMTWLTSVEQQVDEDYPRTFLWCGTADSVVSPENSRMLAARLEAKGVEYRMVEYPGVEHGTGLGIGLACEGWFEDAVKFWRSEESTTVHVGAVNGQF